MAQEVIKLQPSDETTEKLLIRIGEHVLYPELCCIAIDVGIRESKLTHIQADFPGQAKRQVFEVSSIFKYFYRSKQRSYDQR